MVGGDGRVFGCAVPDVVLAHFPSRRDGGARGPRAVASAIRHGTVALVVLLVKWLGHADFWAIKRLCASRGVRCVSLSGGRSGLCELMRAEAAQLKEAGR